MTSERLQGVVQIKEGCPMCFELLLCQDPLVNVFLTEGLQVILKDSHTDFAAVAIQII